MHVARGLRKWHRPGWIARRRVRLPLTLSSWARQDSNLRPTGYEPAALTPELRALRRLYRKAASEPIVFELVARNTPRLHPGRRSVVSAHLYLCWHQLAPELRVHTTDTPITAATYPRRVERNRSSRVDGSLSRRVTSAIVPQDWHRELRKMTLPGLAFSIDNVYISPNLANGGGTMAKKAAKPKKTAKKAPAKKKTAKKAPAKKKAVKKAPAKKKAAKKSTAKKKTAKKSTAKKKTAKKSTAKKTAKKKTTKKKAVKKAPPRRRRQRRRPPRRRRQRRRPPRRRRRRRKPSPRSSSLHR